MKLNSCIGIHLILASIFLLFLLWSVKSLWKGSSMNLFYWIGIYFLVYGIIRSNIINVSLGAVSIVGVKSFISTYCLLIMLCIFYVFLIVTSPKSKETLKNNLNDTVLAPYNRSTQN